MVEQQEISLIDEINKQISEFKINKERNNEEETSNEFIFVNKEESRFWLSLFIKNFLAVNSRRNEDEDDLLFFIRKKPTKFLQQYENKLEVYRKTSNKMPIGDLNIDFEETFYLNVILQKFTYTLVYAVCCRTGASQLEIIKKHVQRIYPSPSKRTMDSKGNYEKITYPEIYFSIDNYEELLDQFPVYNQECVCIEVIAKEINGSTLKSIYFGLVDYDSIKDIVDVKNIPKKSLLTKNNNNNLVFKTRYLNLKGPNDRGIGEIAVQPNHKLDSLETGAFNLEDFEFEKVIETKPMLRRMSDPSLLVGYISNWKERRMQKSKSENEHMNDLGLEFIEAKDINEELRNENTRRLWETPGFSQTYFSNKESRKASYPSYNTYLTYVSLSWFQIIDDALSPANNKKPILIF